MTEFPYQGTWKELLEIEQELRANAEKRRELMDEFETLSAHRRYVWNLIHGDAA